MSSAASEPPVISVVVPVWNGMRWLPDCLDSLAAQTLAPDRTIAVDNGSTDESVAYLRSAHPHVEILELGRNTGFAHAANRGIERATGELVALVNTDVVLDRAWMQRMVSALAGAPGAASVACKMLDLHDPALVYDAGDALRRDGACEQRGRFRRDEGLWDEPAEVFGACAGAAVYRRAALIDAGGFEERYFAYLEDVDLALRLRLAGWICRYEPVVALHAGGGSSSQLTGGHEPLVVRNTLFLVARFFPPRWLALVAYRQAGWLYHAARERRLLAHLRAIADVVPMLPVALRSRSRLARDAVIDVGEAVPARPFRGPRAEGHRSRLGR